MITNLDKMARATLVRQWAISQGHYSPSGMAVFAWQMAREVIPDPKPGELEQWVTEWREGVELLKTATVQQVLEVANEVERLQREGNDFSSYVLDAGEDFGEIIV